MRNLLLVFILILCYRVCYSQMFYSKELHEIYKLCERSCFRLPCEIRKDRYGGIEHIGTQIFGQSAKTCMSTHIIDFLERYNLYLRLLNTDKDKIIYDKNLDVDTRLFFAVDSLCSFSIIDDGSRYNAVWYKDNLEVCRFGFEKNFNLIFGLNIAESQQYFQRELFGFQDSTVIDIPTLGLNTTKNGLIRHDGFYMLESMKSETYFSPSDTMPINSPLKPMETLYNIVAGLVDNSYTLNIVHNLYNYETANYDVNMQKFIKFCVSNGCKQYMGIESVENDTIKATVVFQNTDFNYNHLLYIEFPIQLIGKKKGNIKAKLNTFIPTHNIQNMYNDKN